MEIYRNPELFKHNFEKVIEFPINNFIDLAKFIEYLHKNTDFELAEIYKYLNNFEEIGISIIDRNNEYRITIDIHFHDYIKLTIIRNQIALFELISKDKE